MLKKFGTFLLILIVIVLVVWGYRYISYRTRNAVSDAAFIKSERLALLSFKVGGKVTRFFAKENQKVKKGELLALIDPSDIELTKEQLEHKIDALNQKIEALKTQKTRLKTSLMLKTEIAKTSIEQVQKRQKATLLEIAAKKAKLQKLKNDKERFAKMYNKKLISKSSFEQIQTEVESLEKSLQAFEEKLPILQIELKKATLSQKLAQVQLTQVTQLQKQIDVAYEEQKALYASLQKVKKKLAYTKLYAPFEGIIAKKFFDPPKVVKQGYPVFALVDPKHLYCEVLLSEKKLQGVKVGNNATVTIDAFEGKKYSGKVSSIAPTSASTFSLVPRDIASGEFTKLDQRFIVKISLDSIKNLRAGMGASVAIKRQ